MAFCMQTTRTFVDLAATGVGVVTDSSTLSQSSLMAGSIPGIPLLYSATLTFQQVQELAITNLTNKFFFGDNDEGEGNFRLVRLFRHQGIAAFRPSCKA